MGTQAVDSPRTAGESFRTALTAEASVFLIEDHAMVRKPLLSFLESVSHFKIVAWAISAERAHDASREWNADIVLVDASLPGMSGIQFIAVLLSIKPSARCLILSGHPKATYAQKAFAAGAKGYVEKRHLDALSNAMEAVLAGRTYLTPPAP